MCWTAAAIKRGSDGTKDTTGCPPEEDDGCSGYELMADIDLTAYGRGYDNGSGWEPIGAYNASFTANFDGNDFILSNLYINRSGQNDLGLFGRMWPLGRS